MSLFRIAWRSIQQRGLASVLTMFSMALGVTMVVAVLSIHGVVSKSFQNNSSLGYNLIVGPKGGSLQLTLNSVFYLSRPVGIVPYDFFTEFMPAEQRDAEYRHSIRHHAAAAQWSDIELLAATGAGLPGFDRLAVQVAESAARQAQHKQFDLGRDGKYAQFTALAIPICLGDYFGQFRVVATTPTMFEALKYGPMADQSYAFAQGRNFAAWNREHGYFEAIVGSAVAREMNVSLGDGISPAHGDPEGHGHEQKFTVVGILAPSGTPNDRAAFVNIDGFFLMDGHAEPLEEEESLTATSGGDEHIHHRGEPLPIEQKQVSSVLVRTASLLAGLGMPKLISRSQFAQCVLPVGEITGLFDFFVKPVQWLLLAITAMVCVVSGISILVSIYNSMSDRRHEIAVMRALGASRGTVMSVILLESILLSLGGGLLGWIGGHALNVAASPAIEARTGVTMRFWSLAPPAQLEGAFENPVLASIMDAIAPIASRVSLEIAIIPALLLLAMVVGFLPAWSAYKTDVAKSLGS